MKKSFLLLIIIFIYSSFLFADIGLKHNQKNIRCIQTCYFDIIFPEECSETAAHISVNADSIYQDVCNFYNIVPDLRIPVVLSSATKEFKSYKELHPRTKIILIDSSPDEISSVNSDAILGDFKFQVAQSIVTNHKSDFVKTVDNFTSDSFNFYLISSSAFLSEGPSILYESKDGTGRLHDPYYLHHYKQAAVEENFPGFSDVQGSRDTYPDGEEAFYFGGPFAEFLQKKFGIEKYSEFYYNMINRSLLASSAFQRAFGVYFKDVWTEFSETIDKPNVKKIPLEEDFITDFFSQTDKLSAQNRHGSTYNSFSSTKDGIGYYDISANQYFIAKKRADGSLEKPKSVFSKQNVTNLKFSTDGKYFAVSSLGIKDFNKQYEISIRNAPNLGLTGITLKEKNLRDAAIIESNGEYYLAAVKLNSQYNSISIYRIILDERKNIKKVDFVKDIDFPKGDSVYSLTDAGNGRLACIYQKGFIHSDKPSWQFRYFTNFESAELQTECYEIKIPLEDIRIKFLNSLTDEDDNMIFTFSWATENTFPRLGFIKAEDDSVKISLMDCDISGGVFQLAAFTNSSKELPDVVYNSRLYNRDNLYIMDSTKIPFNDYNSEVIQIDDFSKKCFPETQNDIQEKQILQNATRFKQNILKQSFLIPAGFVNSQSMEFKKYPMIPTAGFMHTFYDLWDSRSFGSSGVYDFFTKTAGFNLFIKGVPSRSGTNKCSYSDNVNFFFDKDGFANAVNNFSISANFILSDIGYIVLKEKNDIFAGHEITHFKFDFGDKWLYFTDPIKDNIFIAKNTLGISYSTRRAAGIGYFERKGINAGINYDVKYIDTYGKPFDLSRLYQGISPVFSISIPKILPFICGLKYSYNLPAQIDTSLYPDENTFFNANAEVIFFSRDFQIQPKYFPLFVRRVIFYGDFYTNIKHENGSMEIVHFFDNLKDTSDMTFSPGFKLTLMFNIKVLSFIDKLGLFNFGVSLSYEPKEMQVPEFGFTWNMVF